MNAVGIDVSKGKSTVAIYQPGDQEILKPRDSCLKTRECAGYFSICTSLCKNTCEKTMTKTRVRNI